jgi:hypothetical protein
VGQVGQVGRVGQVRGPSASAKAPAAIPTLRQAQGRPEPSRGASARRERDCATQILSRLAHRAYRQPVSKAELEPILDFYEAARRNKGTFENGIQRGLERILASPRFAFRVEHDPDSATPGAPYRISDVELASRLSFFLWSSIPDDTLLDLASRGRLKDPAVLEEQVRRMLADPRSSALVDNFAGQWLQLRNVRSVLPNSDEFPDFDDNLRQAFRHETELLFESIIREDRNVVDLLRADYTFVNERVARHYGLPGVYGSRFRRVTLPDPAQRGGLLAHGSILATTSYPERTSPVLRGKYLLDNIFGLPVPPPPPGVNTTLPDAKPGAAPPTIRERLAQHRSNAVCSSCHSAIDPPGFALEQFDAIGGWRTADEAGRPVDAVGTLVNGRTIEGLSGLRAYLLEKPDRFPQTVTEKLLAYALGRRLEYYDRPAVRQIVRDAAAGDFRWSSIVLGIAKSPAFQMRSAPQVTP